MQSPPFLSTSLRGLFALGLLLLGTIASPAAPLVSFMPPDDWPSAGWYQADYGTPTVKTETIDGHSWISIARNDSGGAGSQLVYTAGSSTPAGLPQPSPENQLGDFTGHVTIAAAGWSASDAVGVQLRSRVSVFSGTEGYYLAVNSGSLGLYWGVGTSFISNITPLVSDPLTEALTTLAKGGEYLLWFSAVGNKIDAALYAAWTLNEDGSVNGSPIASLSYTDTRPEARTSGYFSLRGNRFGSTNRPVYFRNLEVHSIPEASTTALAVAGIGLLLWLRRAARIKTV